MRLLATNQQLRGPVTPDAGEAVRVAVEATPWTLVDRGTEQIVISVDSCVDGSGPHENVAWTRSFLNAYPLSILHVGDPTLTTGAGLLAGWGLGHRDWSVEEVLAEVLRQALGRPPQVAVVVAGGAASSVAIKIATLCMVDSIVLTNPYVAWLAAKSASVQAAVDLLFLGDFESAENRSQINPFTKSETQILAFVDVEHSIDLTSNTMELYRLAEQGLSGRGGQYSNIEVQYLHNSIAHSNGRMAIGRSREALEQKLRIL